MDLDYLDYLEIVNELSEELIESSVVLSSISSAIIVANDALESNNIDAFENGYILNGLSIISYNVDNIKAIMKKI